MKTPILPLFAAAMLATFATTVSADAGTRYVNHGRAGYVVTFEKEKTATRSDRRETTVALVMEKPAKPAMSLKTAGRAGYQYHYRGTRSR